MLHAGQGFPGGEQALALGRRDLGVIEGRHGDQPGATEAEVGGTQVACLRKDDQGGHGERDRDGELHDDQPGAHLRAGATAARRARGGEDGRRPKAAEHQGRINACAKAYEQRRQEQDRQNAVRPEIVQRQRRAASRIDQRQRQLAEREPDQGREHGAEERFGHELKRQLTLRRAHHLAHRNLSGAQARSRRGEVHVVHRRQEKRQDADREEACDHRPVARLLQVPAEKGMGAKLQLAARVSA